MKQRAFINMTVAVDLDMVKGPWDKPEDYVNLIRDSLSGAAHYNPEILVHETAVIAHEYVEGVGYVTPKMGREP